MFKKEDSITSYSELTEAWGKETFGGSKKQPHQHFKNYINMQKIHETTHCISICSGLGRQFFVSTKMYRCHCHHGFKKLEIEYLKTKRRVRTF